MPNGVSQHTIKIPDRPLEPYKLFCVDDSCVLSNPSCSSSLFSKNIKEKGRNCLPVQKRSFTILLIYNYGVCCSTVNEKFDTYGQLLLEISMHKMSDHHLLPYKRKVNHLNK